jgi:hypothetical protein
MRVLLVTIAFVGLAVAVGCAKREARELDHSLIRVTSDARLRTDTIGEGRHADLATFVLVEAENTSKAGAYVTLAGELVDEAGAIIGQLRPQSLWVPGGELRTFALVDQERMPRPTAKGARIYVRGARVNLPPPARVEDIRQIPDGDKLVLQGVLKSDAKRPGNVMVIATFYGDDGRPMTRPFSVLWIPAKGDQPVQFVGPPGSTRGTIFIGDTAF